MGVFCLLDSCAMMLQDACIPIKEYPKPNQQNQMKKQSNPTIRTTADRMKFIHKQLKRKEGLLRFLLRKEAAAEKIERIENHIDELNDKFLSLINQ